MFNGFIIGTVVPFSGTSSTDKNGAAPVMIQVIAGKCPNRQVLSGTVAQRAGLELDKTYLINVREQGFDKQFGLDYTFTKVKELNSGEDIIRTAHEIGQAQVFMVEKPEAFDGSYERKSVAVVGARTQRIKKGNYIPATFSTAVDHSTAPREVSGSSTESNTHFPNPERKSPRQEDEDSSEGKGMRGNQ